MHACWRAEQILVQEMCWYDEAHSACRASRQKGQTKDAMLMITLGSIGNCVADTCFWSICMHQTHTNSVRIKALSAGLALYTQRHIPSNLDQEGCMTHELGMTQAQDR